MKGTYIMIEYLENKEIKRKDYTESKTLHIVFVLISIVAAVFAFVMGIIAKPEVRLCISVF